MEILEDRRADGELLTMICKFNRLPGEPEAPAGLYVSPNDDLPIVELHRVVESYRDTFVFETYGSASRVSIDCKAHFAYRAWWTKAAMRAAIDLQAEWHLIHLDETSSHDHCLFTWETIGGTDGLRTAYANELHGWITPEAHEKYIVQDVYRLRRNT